MNPKTTSEKSGTTLSSQPSQASAPIGLAEQLITRASVGDYPVQQFDVTPELATRLWKVSQAMERCLRAYDEAIELSFDKHPRIQGEELASYVERSEPLQQQQVDPLNRDALKIAPISVTEGQRVILVTPSLFEAQERNVAEPTYFRGFLELVSGLERNPWSNATDQKKMEDGDLEGFRIAVHFGLFKDKSVVVLIPDADAGNVYPIAATTTATDLKGPEKLALLMEIFAHFGFELDRNQATIEKCAWFPKDLLIIPFTERQKP